MGMDPITIGLGATAAGALLGGIGGSQKSGGGTQTQNSSSAPWAEQAPFLTYGFDQAKTAAGNALANPVYTGQRVAGLNPFQTAGANNLGGFANSYFNTAGRAMDASSNMMNSGSTFGLNANNIFNQYGTGDQMGAALAAGNTFANNPYVNGLIDASSRDVTRNLYENQLPGVNRTASGTGNLNSTRAGVESAIAQRGAADRLTDLSSNIRSQFFNNGVTQYNQNLQNALSANNPLLNAFNSGLSGMSSGQRLASGFFDQSNAAGGLYQNQNQNELNANLAQFNETNQNPLNYIQQYMQSVGGNYGGTSNSSTQLPSTGGGFGGALNGMIGGGLGALGTAAYAKKAGIFGS